MLFREDCCKKRKKKKQTRRGFETLHDIINI